VLHEGTPTEAWAYELSMSRTSEKSVFEADLDAHVGLFP
jgi:hypothetical protein